MNLNILKYLNLKKKVNNTLRKKNNLTNYTAQAIKHKKNNTKIKYKITETIKKVNTLAVIVLSRLFRCNLNINNIIIIQAVLFK